jgi:putative Mg2+ transporter-C (MgtC) family protein
MSDWWEGVAADFTDLPGTAQVIRVGVRLLIAACLGGLLGLERLHAHKDAGLRTHMLICLGSAFITVVPQQMGMGEAALSRVLQGLLAGIGFLGGGAILKLQAEKHVLGLTTAAGLWLTAVVGAAAGLGREAVAVLATVLALVILALLRPLERQAAGKTEGGPPGQKQGPNDHLRL